MKALFITTAAIEVGAGLALLCCPSPAMVFLLGTPLGGPVGSTVARIGGAGLLSLGLSCWIARSDGPSRTAKGLVAAMTFYNAAAVAILAFAGIGFGLHGLALWPAVALHSAMLIWSAVCLR
jgi:hypothetical protein